MSRPRAAVSLDAMQQIARILFATLLLAAASSRAAGDPARYELDAEHTTIAFLVEHIGYAKTLGQFRSADGGFTFDAESGELSALRVAVETASIDTHHEARDRHLRSADFLDSDRHPTMTFTGSGAERTGERTFTVTGELTLLGRTRPLTLDATLNKTAAYPIGDRAEVVGVSARGSLKRSEFGMTYGVADRLVGDDVEIIIEIEARRSGETQSP
jgi:polyisoprenoid-binding protein YceI